MGRLVHTGLGSSSLVAHVLHYPSPHTNNFIIGTAVINIHTPPPASGLSAAAFAGFMRATGIARNHHTYFYMSGTSPWVQFLAPTCCSRGCAVHDRTPYTAHTFPETLSHSLLAWCRSTRAGCRSTRAMSDHSFSRVSTHLRSFFSPTGTDVAHIYHCNGKLNPSRNLCNGSPHILSSCPQAFRSAWHGSRQLGSP